MTNLVFSIIQTDMKALKSSLSVTNKNDMIIPVILSGGVGSRLWPLSRAKYPKQLLSLIGNQSMLQQTLKRVSKAERQIIVCQENQRFLIAEQASQYNVDIILEPVGRNTAPAIALAAWHSLTTNKDAILLAMPADHLITDSKTFNETIELANAAAKQDYLITFGVKPDYPETGYGYIQSSEQLTDHCFQVNRFVEKPDTDTAQRYLDSDEYFWNSGIFLFKASSYLSQLKELHPEIYQNTKTAAEKFKRDGLFLRPKQADFESCPDESIDYAVMEKTTKAAMIKVNFGWSDIGSWKSLWKVSAKDEQNNSIIGDVISHDTQDCHIHASHRLIGTVGARDLVIVETADSVLVANKNKVQDVKHLVNQLKSQQRPETDLHRKVYRPWGSYEGVDIDDTFQVKRITVKPGAKLSLQKHRYRAEHWIVVRGVATVTCEEKVFDIRENESTYIPLGSLHRLENKQDSLLELIEVQTGTYFGEDDIVRLEDVYNRNQSE